MSTKTTSVEDAVAVVQTGDTLCTSGFVGIGTPDALLTELERRFTASGQPRDLTLLFAAGQGDGKDRGLNALGHDGLLKRVVGGHWGLIPKIGRLAVEGKIEAYNLPQGVISHLYRDIAAGKPGTISRVGLGTFVDPRLEGGRINSATTEELVRLIHIDGKDWLFYRTFPIQVAFLRGTTADPEGNITAEREALTLDNLAMAMAAKNSGGIVIVQVERLARTASLNPRTVLIPGILVDCVVLAEPRHHPQTYGTIYNPAFSAEVTIPAENLAPMPLNERKVIARRCALELRAGAIVNLGIGMPEGVAAIAAEEQVFDLITLTTEPGVVGGIPGGLDLAFLGMAEIDAEGNVNVSRFGSRIAGAGGFINISQNARKVVFAGTFTTGGVQIKVSDAKLKIAQEGRAQKFRKRVQQITFSGRLAAQSEKPAMYVTERCVFELRKDGLELTEIAPGVDLERDVLALMEFRPLVNEVRLMDERIFRPEPLGLKSRLLDLDLSERLTYDPHRNILFINFEGLQVRRVEDVAIIHARVTTLCSEIGKRVAVVVNYNGFSINGPAVAVYADMVRDLEGKYYTKVARYTTSAFMRVKLGEALTRVVRPHIFESKGEAQAFHRKVGMP